MKPIISNPILPGFHPDPSIVRVGADYYIATSTFEWFPGVQIHHSRDLKQWTPLGGALTRREQLDLRGIPNSGGVWAPCLTWCDGLFYLVYSIMRTWAGTPYNDVHNYLVTAPDIHGPWSDPIYLNSSGFDPSLFHDTDGRKWVLNMQWDFRPGRPRFNGILLQEYDPITQRLIGDVKKIMRKDRLIEGPHLYRRGDYYYLMLAEGGTGWNHACTMARAKQMEGPYEQDPMGDFLTTRHALDYPLQKCGHGALVQTPEGDWYTTFLCSRPVGPNRRSILGRETGLAPCHWTEEGWLRLDNPEAPCPPLTFTGTYTKDHDAKGSPASSSFSNNPRLQTLRIPTDPSWYDTTSRPGWVRLRGRESPCSVFDQSLVAFRVTHFHMRAETTLQFEPDRFSQMAGLLAWYDTRTHYFLHVTHTEDTGKALRLSWMDDGTTGEQADFNIPLHDGSSIGLAFQLDEATLQFFWRQDEAAWQPAGPLLDATRLADEYGTGLHFTGAFAAIAAYDINGSRTPADFKHFTCS